MIRFERVSKVYPNGTVAISDLSLVAPTGQITVFIGPSGCGKTTSLRMVNRLIEPSSGSIHLGDEDAGRLERTALRRRIGYVIQHAGLFPHRTIEDNVAVTARLNGVPRRRARATAHELLERVGLDERYYRRYPWQLSGGQQQRVGVARALGADSEFLLMDEPFSAVDPIVRGQLQDEFLRLQKDFGKTIIMVTHDVDEALKLGDSIAVFSGAGRIEQFAAPSTLLREPASPFVSQFLGADRAYRALSFSASRDSVLPIQAGIAVSLGSDVAAQDPEESDLDGWRVVLDADGAPVGWLDPAYRGAVTPESLVLPGTLATRDASLRELLVAALGSPCSVGLIVTESGEYVGLVALGDVTREIEATRRSGRESLV